MLIRSFPYYHSYNNLSCSFPILYAAQKSRVNNTGCYFFILILFQRTVLKYCKYKTVEAQMLFRQKHNWVRTGFHTEHPDAFHRSIHKIQREINCLNGQTKPLWADNYKHNTLSLTNLIKYREPLQKTAEGDVLLFVF